MPSGIPKQSKPLFRCATIHKLMLVVKHSCSTSFLFRLQHPFSGISSTEEWCGDYVVSGRKEHANNDLSKTTVRYALTDSSGARPARRPLRSHLSRSTGSNHCSAHRIASLAERPRADQHEKHVPRLSPVLLHVPRGGRMPLECASRAVAPNVGLVPSRPSQMPNPSPKRVGYC